MTDPTKTPLDLTRFEGHTEGPWKDTPSIEFDHFGVYPSTGKMEFPICLMPDITKSSVNEANARLIAAAPDLLAQVQSLTEQNAALVAERDRLVEALTPSAETKGAYIGEFERLHEHIGVKTIPWTSVKQIMAAILARATQPKDPS